MHDTSRQFYEEALIDSKIGFYDLRPIVNKYYGVTGEPWYHALTAYGIITVGHGAPCVADRKRVYSIDWSRAWAVSGVKMMQKLENEKMPGANAQITFDHTFCHAWTEEKFQEYLNHIPNCLSDDSAKQLQKMKDSLMAGVAKWAEDINTAMQSLKLIDTNEWHIKKGI